METLEREKEINHFFITMETISQGARSVGKQLALEIGSNFNVIDYMRTDEIGLSLLVASLLNPNGTHGQGSVFLKLFMDECGFSIEDYHDLENVSVITEMSFDNGRMDIVIQFSPDTFLVIENKPYALEQADQMQRYADFINGKKNDRGLLVYMPGYSEKSETLPVSIQDKLNEDSKRYAELVYNSADNEPAVVNWLLKCEKEARAPKIRVFLADFADWAKAMFPEISLDSQEENNE